jgi:hypothetical protein
LRFAVIAICLALASWRALRLDLRNYFTALLIQCATCEILLLKYPYDSTQYAWGYVILVLPTFIFAVPLVHKSIAFVPFRPILIAFAMYLAYYLVRKGLGQHPNLFSWIMSIEGGWDAFNGTLAGIGAGSSLRHQTMDWESRKIALSLSLFWLSQSAVELGWSLHLSSPVWVRINDLIPTMIVASASLWLAFFCSGKRRSRI